MLPKGGPTSVAVCTTDAQKVAEQESSVTQLLVPTSSE